MELKATNLFNNSANYYFHTNPPLQLKNSTLAGKMIPASFFLDRFSFNQKPQRN
jgi:hypothetical protein